MSAGSNHKSLVTPDELRGHMPYGIRTTHRRSGTKERKVQLILFPSKRKISTMLRDPDPPNQLRVSSFSKDSSRKAKDTIWAIGQYVN
jgi:hypothetical protein